MTFVPADGWGPDRKRAALCVTFDNLGEAGMLDRGEWDGPVGEHFTADFVPELIAALGDTRATYFIEASNVALYPRAIAAWHAAGHEVALHAWRHEFWGRIPADQRRALLARSIAAMATLGIHPVGFRPPGGAMPPEAWAEFEAAGLRYCSDFGEPGIERIGDMVRLPFAWRNVDAYVVEALAAPLRLAFGGTAEAGGMEDWRRELDAAVDGAVAEGGQRTVIFHPEFIGASAEKLAAVRHLIARAQAADMWIAPAREVAAFAAERMGLRQRDPAMA